MMSLPQRSSHRRIVVIRELFVVCLLFIAVNYLFLHGIPDVFEALAEGWLIALLVIDPLIAAIAVFRWTKVDGFRLLHILGVGLASIPVMYVVYGAMWLPPSYSQFDTRVEDAYGALVYAVIVMVGALAGAVLGVLFSSLRKGRGASVAAVR